ncbi:ASPIC/UnbV domain protein [Rhodopirellula maiorica SM1]|uniref:ASPIC/UnbV domain protein n=1 Tax=Rhodopirellula maiorica SM1 TaxID=1265738 RepID=M5S5J1_9BACT|nr:FG-GAP-like repeat-containing protein [Rhodopirellula maiorica]EMI21459.1 ASPIC/UnbV domain protein [Rhodopirellula maiorica SM1]
MMIPADRPSADRSRLSRMIIRLMLICLLAISGCDRPNDLELDPGTETLQDPDSLATPDSLSALHAAIDRQHWTEAWELSPVVLSRYPGDADAIASVARVALENQKQDLAGDLMIDACRAESLSNASRIQQAIATLAVAGRIYDAIDLLDECVDQYPQQHSMRRMLFNFYHGVEDHVHGIPHGRVLVRHRQFDLPLLLALCSSEIRTESADPLVEMARRNAKDKRPLIAEAKIQYDLGKMDDAASLLDDCLRFHPNYAPALALNCRVLFAQHRQDDLVQIAETRGDEIDRYPNYWIAIGDFASSQQHDAEATRAYWEATRCDADDREAWVKLSTSLRRLGDSHRNLDVKAIAAIENRVMQLSQLAELKSSMTKRDRPDRGTAIEIATTLQQLGRLWEAEAWAAFATTLADDNNVQVNQVRQSIIAALRKDTPWQSLASHPELTLDLSELPLPRLANPNRVLTKRRSSPTPAAVSAGPPSTMALIDEASQRSLKFWGRTGDDLDRPGVMFYQTVGCGGGAIDFDLDGWIDLYLTAAGGTPSKRDSAANGLMRNHDGVFSNVASQANVDDRGFGQGVAIGDVNEDGFSDILVLNYGPNTLLVNNGDGTFADASNRLDHHNVSTWSTSAAIADLDADGLADLVIVNYCGGMKPVSDICRDLDSEIARACSPIVFPAAVDGFMKNRGDGDFVDQTTRWNARPLVSGRGLGVTAGEFDHQAGVDVFVANDMTSNHYWSRSNDSQSVADFQLTESAILRGLGSDDRSAAQGSMGIAVADFDRDGGTDFYVTNFVNECNTYHVQERGGLWRDQTAIHQLYKPTLPMVGFGTQAVDLDNDAVLELVVSNGHVDHYRSGDHANFYAQPMQVFQRRRFIHGASDGEFVSIADRIAGDYLKSPHVGRALWTLDANRDGRTDLVVTHQTEPVSLLMNHCDPAGDWLQLQLVGRDCSRDAIGAKVNIQAGDQQWTVGQYSGDGFLCSNERVIHVGMGNAKDDCVVVVSWPDGQIQRFHQLAVNARWLLVQGDADAFRCQ